MSRPLRLIVCGASGRMGSQVGALARADERFSLCAGVGRRTGDKALRLLLSQADVAVDFSAPAGSTRFAAAAAQARLPLVIGTTGLSSAQRAAVARHARRTPIFMASNFSAAVYVLCRLAARAARALPAYDAGVFETHHAAKRDAPSGTALTLARGLAKKVPIVSQRLGGVVGEHTLTLAGPYDRLELTHRAQSRAVFARGALDAAVWLSRRKPGLYGMDDRLGALL